MCINCKKKKARSLQGEWDKDKHRKNEKEKTEEEENKKNTLTEGSYVIVYTYIYGMTHNQPKYACATQSLA